LSVEFLAVGVEEAHIFWSGGGRFFGAMRGGPDREAGLYDSDMSNK
jgi:hypothetical protein